MAVTFIMNLSPKHSYYEIATFLYIVCLLIIHYRETKYYNETITLKKTRLSSIVKVMPALFWIKDEHNKFVYTNAEIQKGLVV